MATKLKRLLGVVASIQLLVLLGWVPSAQAHAAYESSDPANGAEVSSPPERVTADFTERVVDESRLEVYDPCGLRVDNGDSLVVADRITVSMSADKQGTYRVVFNVISSIDGHPTNGEFTFVSSGGALCAASEPEEKESRDTRGEADQTESGEGSSGKGATTGSASTNSVGADGGNRAKGANPARRGSKGRPGNGRSLVPQRKGKPQAPVSAGAPEVLSAQEGDGGTGDIPLSGLLFSLALAACIGALAGKIYLNLVDPHT